jgi:predicted transcriptional regulator
MAFTLRTDAELEAALSALSEIEAASRQEIIRRAVFERLERTRHEGKVRDTATHMMDRWGDVLHRLGTA